MGRLILVLAVLAILVGMWRWLTRSKWFDNFFKSTVNPPSFDETTDDIIAEIEEDKHQLEDKAVEAAINFVEEGKTEKEMAKVLGITMLEEGADMPRSLSVSSGVGNYDVLNGLGTARVFQAGDMINFDFGTYYKGYCSDITRSIFVGEPSARQRDFYEAIK